MSETTCFVCDKQRGLVDVPGGCLYEDDLVYASHGIIDPEKKRAYIGTLFVEPKRHVSGIAELTDTEAERIGKLSARLARALKQSADVEHVYVHVLGHHVDHLHVWLVPRYRGTPIEFWPVRLAEWPGAPKGDAAAIRAFCDRLRTHMNDRPEFRCGFCGKTNTQVKKLIAGGNISWIKPPLPEVIICNECVELCMHICAVEDADWCDKQIERLTPEPKRKKKRKAKPK